MGTLPETVLAFYEKVRSTLQNQWFHGIASNCRTPFSIWGFEHTDAGAQKVTVSHY